MITLPPEQRFWVAVLTIGGYLLFGGLAAFFQTTNSAVALSVLSTMGPLVGWVIKGLFDAAQPSGEKDDPVYVEEEK